MIRDVKAGGEGLFADFHFNPKHALAEQLLWDAEHAPENVGFSHNVEARTARRGEPRGRRGHHPRAERRPGGRSGHDAGAVRVAGGQQAAPAGDATCRPAALTLDDLKRDYPDWSRRSVPSRPPKCAGWRRKWPALTGATSRCGGSARPARQLLPRVPLARGRVGPIPRRRPIASPRFIEIAVGGAGRTGDAGVGRGAGAAGPLAAAASEACGGCQRPLSRDQHLADGVAAMRRPGVRGRDYVMKKVGQGWGRTAHCRLHYTWNRAP